MFDRSGATHTAAPRFWRVSGIIQCSHARALFFFALLDLFASVGPVLPIVEYISLMLEQLHALARYNRWMNDRLFAVAAELSDDERKRDLGAFFRSIHGTLNHLLLADRIWLARFGVLEQPRFAGMGEELFADFGELQRGRVETDEAISAFVGALTEDRLAAPIAYSRGQRKVEHPLWFAVLHLFNHQTHHRGQVTTLLMQLGRDPGVTDLIALLRDSPQ